MQPLVQLCTIVVKHHDTQGITGGVDDARFILDRLPAATGLATLGIQNPPRSYTSIYARNKKTPHPPSRCSVPVRFSGLAISILSEK